MTRRDEFMQAPCTRRQLLATAAGGVLLALVPARGRASDESVQTRKSASGELTEAWYSRGQEKVHLKVTRQEFVSRRRDAGKGYRVEFVFTENDRPLLRMQAVIQRQHDERSLGQGSLTARGDLIDYSISIDARQIRVPESGVVSEGKAKVDIRSGHQAWRGELDLRTGELTGQGAAPRLVDALPETVKEKLAPFQPELQSSLELYKKKSEGAFRPERGGPAGERSVAGRLGGKLCRAACWGIGGALAALCCAGGIGLGCVLGGGIAGTAASFAADSCPS
jgi:hypothetical protein